MFQDHPCLSEKGRAISASGNQTTRWHIICPNISLERKDRAVGNAVVHSNLCCVLQTTSVCGCRDCLPLGENGGTRGK